MSSDHDPYIIGIDGGGSTCRVGITRADGSVIATAKGAAANPATSLPGAIETLLQTLETARAKAGLSTGDLASAQAHFGLAGAINAHIAGQVARAMPIRNLTVTDDRPTNMAGALGDADGYVAAIGTGSFIGRQTGGNHQFVGGWGLQLGDEASGAWLGKRLLSLVLKWQDGLRDGTNLLHETLAGFAGDPSAIVLFAVEADPPGIAGYAKKIVAAASAGDTAGRALMREGAEYIQTALSHLGFSGSAPLCLIGGLGAHYRPHLDPQFTANLILPRGTALDGALAIAARMPAPARGSAA